MERARMLEVQKLAAKQRLDGDDAFTLLQFLQDHTTPILSLRSVGSSPVASTQHPASRLAGKNNGASESISPCMEGRGEMDKAAARGTAGRGRGEGANGRVPESGVERATPEGAGPLAVPSSKRTLFGGSPLEFHPHTQRRSPSAATGGSASPLDVNNLEEFPPMQAAATVPVRKKDKKTSKPRRITLTSMQQQQQQQQPHTSVHTHTAHFTPLPSHASDRWSSHPAFVVEAATSSDPSPLSEERRLLRQERSKLRKGGAAAKPPLHPGRGSQHTNQLLQTTGVVVRKGQSRSPSSGVKVTSREKQRPQPQLSLSEQSLSDGLQNHCQISSSSQAGTHSSGTLLQARVGGYATDELKEPQRKSPSSTPGPPHSEAHSLLSQSTLSTMNGGSVADSSPLVSSSPAQPQSDSSTLTSTPLPATLPAIAARSEVSVGKITDRAMLERLAALYSKLITDRLVANLTSEIHFLVQLLTCTQPARHLQSVPGSEQLFQSVESCVYFAATVLYNIRSLLTALDKATLQLFSENIRIKQLQPQLSEFFAAALERACTEVTAGHRPVLQTAFKRVPFQEDTDNIKNFPNMKVFHAFKKQRDLFYSVLREWEAHHETPNWQFQSALRDKIRLLVSQPPELCSLDHLARLFQKQLLESCGYAAHIAVSVGGLEGPLKKLNPDKLMKLSERFMRQSSFPSGACPPPVFSQAELFFSAFITTADSFVFNHYLTGVLRHELLKLHSRCESVVARDVPEVLHALRVLAKFLGYLDFLPYSSVLSPAFLPTRTSSPHSAVVAECVCEAREKGHLCLTIPWAVEYLAMMDSHALRVAQHHSLLCQLMDVYRTPLVERGHISTDTFLVLACLGWLFEIPNVPNSVFFEYLKTSTTSDLPLPQAETELMTREVLYICCPYLAGIRTMLAEFAAGLQTKTSPIRKIKPIPAETGKPLTHLALSSQLQVKLQENFFRSHPPYLKQLCETISERVADTAIVLVQSQVVPRYIKSGLRVLAGWIAEQYLVQQSPECSGTTDDLFRKHEAARTVARVSEQTFSSVLRETAVFCKQHIETNTKTAFSSLLCGTISEQVVAAAVGIAVDWAMDHCTRWMHATLRGVVFEEVRGGFDRLKKAVRAAGKAGHSTDMSSSSANSTSRLHVDQASLGDDSASLSSLTQPGFFSVAASHSFSESLPASEDIDSSVSNPVSQFMELASSLMRDKDDCPSAERVQCILAATVNVRTCIASQVAVIPGGRSPHLLPCGVDRLLMTSVQLAALLVSYSLLCGPNTGDCNTTEKYTVLTKEIVSLWDLLKGLKQEIPIYILLSSESVRLYLQRAEKDGDVWRSLACLLVESIACGVVTADVMEALWMCRVKQLTPHQRRPFMNGGATFLARWYSQDHTVRECPGCRTHLLKDICFVRLLSLVVSEPDIPSIAGLHNHPSLHFMSL